MLNSSRNQALLHNYHNGTFSFTVDSLFHEGLVFLPVIRIKHLHAGSSTEAVVFHAQWFRPLLSVFEKSQGRNDGTATWRMNGLKIWLPSRCFEGVIL